MFRQRNLPSVLLLQSLHIYGVCILHSNLTVAIEYMLQGMHTGEWSS